MVVLLLLIALASLSSTALIVPEAVFALGEPAAPRPIPIFVNEQVVGDSCGGTQTVFLGDIRSAGFEGGVNLTLVDPPKGVTGTFVPNPVMLISGFENYTMLIVNLVHDAPLGRYPLRIRLTPLPDSNYGAWGVEDKSLLDTNVTLDYVHQCIDSGIEQYNPPYTTTTISLFASTSTTTETHLSTITSTSITTVSTAFTSTTTSTESVTDPSTYAWAIGATGAAVVLAVVLLLRRSR